jgi:hypothetical protein
MLERIFFHDVMNLAGALHGILELLPELPDAEAAKYGQMATLQAGQLIEEIACQRDLIAAEQGDLAVSFTPVDVGELLERLCVMYRQHPVGKINHWF